MIMREFAMDQEIATMAYSQLMDLLSPEGHLRLEAFQIMIDFGRAAQKIDRPVSANQLIDSALLEDVLREGAAKR
jgi:hypothetical protein